MSDVQVLLICCLIAFITICVVYAMNKATAARLFVHVVDPNANLPKSSYGVSRESVTGTWGYCITKNGSVMFSGGKSKLFESIDEAIEEINKLEGLEGFRKSKIG